MAQCEILPWPEAIFAQGLGTQINSKEERQPIGSSAPRKARTTILEAN
jgi:hypothetical protein